MAMDDWQLQGCGCTVNGGTNLIVKVGEQCALSHRIGVHWRDTIFGEVETTPLSFPPPTVQSLPGSPPPPLPSLYKILDNVDELYAYREEAIEDGALADEIAGIDKAIDEVLSAEVIGKKADGICNTVHAWESKLAEAQALEDRATARRKFWQNRIDYLKERTLHAMLAHNVPRIETATNRLRVQGNGGRQELETNPEAIPLGYLEQTVTLPCVVWADIGHWLGKLNGGLEVWHKLSDKLMGASPEPDNKALRAALAQHVICPECKGDPVYLGAVVDGPKCPTCEGKGTVPATVPGARVLPRGKHLRIE